jgi:hypothetical protein
VYEGIVFMDFSADVMKQLGHGIYKRIELKSGANVTKLFTVVSYEFLKYARAFVPGKLFQPNLMFAGKVRRLPLSGAPFRLGWKSLPGTTALASYENS